MQFEIDKEFVLGFCWGNFKKISSIYWDISPSFEKKYRAALLFVKI